MAPNLKVTAPAIDPAAIGHIDSNQNKHCPSLTHIANDSACASTADKEQKDDSETLALRSTALDASTNTPGTRTKRTMGVVFDIPNTKELSSLDDDHIKLLLHAIRVHGVIVIKGQNLTRAEQVAFTRRLGDIIILPPSLEGQDPEPFQPAIQRVTNFWVNGTWKGPGPSFGSYWHQDGDFWVRPKHNILSVLHAQAIPPTGGETGFADLRAARATLPKPLVERASNATIHVSVREIGDFAQGTEEDLSLFPDATHPVLDTHSVDGGPMLYLGSKYSNIVGLESPEAGKALLDELLDHATAPSFTYYHAWEVGDVVMWDNTQTLHRSMPYENDGTARRELYRTQARARLGDLCGDQKE